MTEQTSDSTGQAEDDVTLTVEEERLLLQQAKQHASAPWSPTQRLLLAAWGVAASLECLGLFPEQLGGYLPLPFWVRGAVWAVCIASSITFAISVTRDDDDEWIPEPLRSHLGEWRKAAKAREDRE